MHGSIPFDDSRGLSGGMSLSGMVDLFARHPIPDPDFCEKISKTLTCSALEDRENVYTNMNVRLTGIEDDDTETDSESESESDYLRLLSAVQNETPKFNLYDGDLLDLETPPSISVSLDIDSLIGFGFPLSLIKTTIFLDTIPSRGRNLSSPLHGIVMGINEMAVDVHRIPQFRLGYFGTLETKSDLFILLPKLYETVKSNQVPKAVIKAWVNDVLIPTATEVLPNDDRYQWSTTYEQEILKLQAKREGVKKVAGSGKETQKLGDGDEEEDFVVLWDSKMMESPNPIAPDLVVKFSQKLEERLNNAIASADENSPLRSFEGYRLLSSGKNWKLHIKERSGDFQKLLEKNRKMVQPREFNRLILALRYVQ